MHHVCNCMCKVTLGISGHSNYSSRLLQTLLFEHSCNTALVVAALNYNIPDSEVRCLLPKRWPKICHHFTPITLEYFQDNERRLGPSTSK